MKRATFTVALALQFWALYVPRTPGVDTPDLPLDKVVHFGLFAVVVWLGLRAGIPARWLVPLMLGQAVVSELVQWRLLEQRGGDWWDLLADVLGVLVGWLLGRSAATTEAAASRR